MGLSPCLACDPPLGHAWRSGTRRLSISPLTIRYGGYAYTSRGATDGRIARRRPRLWLLAAAMSAKVSRRVCEMWGEANVLRGEIRSQEEMVRRAAEEFRWISDILALGTGIPLCRAGTANNLQVAPGS